MTIKQENALEFVSKYELGLRFSQDEKIFRNQNSTYIRIYYENITYLLYSFNYLSVKNQNVEDLSIQNVNIAILISAIPFILNTPWTSNIFIIIDSIH